MNQIKNREKLLETKKNDRRENSPSENYQMVLTLCQEQGKALGNNKNDRSQNSPSENYQMVLTLCLERTTAVNGHSRLAW